MAEDELPRVVVVVAPLMTLLINEEGEEDAQ